MNLKKTLGIMLTIIFITQITGCQKSVVSSPNQGESSTYIFVDSSGREIELPKNIERIAPSGTLSQIVLYTLCPDKMAGYSSEINEKQLAYTDEKHLSLPVFGSFYSETLNLESVMQAAPEVIIDIGEPKNTVKEDMDSIQEKTGIPTIFIEMNINSLSSAYKTLGEITGETEQAQKISDYIDKVLSETKEKVAGIPEAERVKVYYGRDEGTTAVVSGTIHDEIISIAGGENVSVVEENIKGGASEISLEQLMLWNPDIILFELGITYNAIAENSKWQEIEAVKNNKYYEIPDAPYNWIGRPPSVNRILGVKWLSNLLYPEIFDYDMVKETQEFYKLFYHYDISPEQVNALLENSTYKAK